MDADHERPFLLPLDSDAATLATVGGKGASLARLVRAGLVEARRAITQREQLVTPPVTLGSATFMGFDFSALMPAHSSQQNGDTITRSGASPGHVVGAAQVIHGPGEFKTMR